MSENSNRAIMVSSRPTGIPGPEHFNIINLSIPELHDGQFLVKNKWLSVDPAMRGWLADANNYASVAVGEVMRSLAVGEVIKSKDPSVPVGTKLMGWFGWQHYAVVDKSKVVQEITNTSLPESLYLGVLGLNGITAATAFDKIGQPKPGDTVVVSTAAGGVGSCVGQLAKNMGCTTIGITSSPEKMQLCTDEFGYDFVLNYKTDDINASLKSICPDGANIYFDNTSGAISDAVMQNLALNARVIICGTASISQWSPLPMGPRVERILLTRRARMEGFILFDHMDTYPDYVKQLEQAITDGKLKYQEDISQGLESATSAIQDLYNGKNMGKRLVQL